MCPKQLTTFKEAIDQITDTSLRARMMEVRLQPVRVVSNRNYLVRDVSARIHNRFVEHLSTWYRWYKREAATLFEARAQEDRAGPGEVIGERARAERPDPRQLPPHVQRGIDRLSRPLL